MNTLPITAAAMTQPTHQTLALSGAWTGRGLGAVGQQLDALSGAEQSQLVVDGAAIETLDTAGAWVLQKFLARLRTEGATVQMRDLRPEFANLFEAVGRHLACRSPPLQ